MLKRISTLQFLAYLSTPRPLTDLGILGNLSHLDFSFLTLYLSGLVSVPTPFVREAVDNGMLAGTPSLGLMIHSQKDRNLSIVVM